MTRKQKRAAYNFQDKVAWKEARLEEEAMIAEQKALEAATVRPVSSPAAAHLVQVPRPSVQGQ